MVWLLQHCEPSDSVRGTRILAKIAFNTVRPSFRICLTVGQLQRLAGREIAGLEAVKVV